MSVIIGSARIDEHGKAKGGKAGDQNGKEVSTQKWYKHTKVWRVFRAKDEIIAEKIADDMQLACDNKNIGYDQGQRLTLYNIAKDVDFNCSKVTKKCETDCSALVRVCCAYAGVMLPNFRTPTEPEALLDSGYFVEMVGKKYSDSSDYLKRGDILVTSTQGHTVVVLTNGDKVKPMPKPDPKEVIITGGSVYVRTAPNKETGKELGIVHRGDILPYQGVTSSGGWYLVIYENQNGWISGKYSTLVNEECESCTI